MIVLPNILKIKQQATFKIQLIYTTNCSNPYKAHFYQIKNIKIKGWHIYINTIPIYIIFYN